MTSHEFDESQPISLEQLKLNPDLLLQGTALADTFYAPERLLGVNEVPLDSHKTEVEREIEEVQKFALGQIVRPEQAARTAVDITARTVEELAPMMQHAGLRLGDTEVGATEAVQIMKDILDDSTEALSLAQELRGVIYEPAVIKKGDWQVTIDRLQAFARNHDAKVTQVNDKYEESYNGARAVHGDLDLAEDDARRNKNRIQVETERDLNSAMVDESAVLAVVRRAAPTITEHKQGCDDVVTNAIDAVTGVADKSKTALRDAGVLVSKISSAREIAESTPSGSVIGEKIDGLKRVLYAMADPQVGRDRATDAAEMLTAVEELLHGVQTSHQSTSESQKGITEYVEKIRTQITAAGEQIQTI